MSARPRRWFPAILRTDSAADTLAKVMGVVAFCALLGWWLRALITAASLP